MNRIHHYHYSKSPETTSTKNIRGDLGKKGPQELWSTIKPEQKEFISTWRKKEKPNSLLQQLEAGNNKEEPLLLLNHKLQTLSQILMCALAGLKLHKLRTYSMRVKETP